MPKKKELIVDDNATVLGAVRPLFDSHPNFEVCGEAEHGREAVQKAPSLRPDLILLDLSMPVMSGLEAAPLSNNIGNCASNLFDFVGRAVREVNQENLFTLMIDESDAFMHWRETR